MTCTLFLHYHCILLVYIRSQKSSGKYLTVSSASIFVQSRRVLLVAATLSRKELWDVNLCPCFSTVRYYTCKQNTPNMTTCPRRRKRRSPLGLFISLYIHSSPTWEHRYFLYSHGLDGEKFFLPSCQKISNSGFRTGYTPFDA